MNDLIAELEAFFGRDPHGAVAVYVYGSIARGDDTSASDVDVAVLFRTPSQSVLDSGRLTLEGELERRLRRRVDLVELNSASADLVHRVLRDGTLVLDGDRAGRIRFEVAKRNEYFDLEVVRRRYRQAPAANGAINR